MPVIDNKFDRWDVKVDHPSERCESTTTHGQCPFKKGEHSNYCPMHGANKGVIAEKEELKRNYLLRRWKSRVDAFADNDQLKSLREEVGILRMLMEEILNKCEDSTDLLMMSSRISDLAMKIERLVISCDKLENRMGMLLSKNAVIQLAVEYVSIITNHVQDTAVIERISQEMFQATNRLDVLTDA